jgi:hypothetical protein
MIKKILKSICIGFVVTSMLIIVIFILSHFGIHQPFMAFIHFGYLLCYLLGIIMPSSLVYWFVPDGGPLAALGLMIISSWSQLVLLMATVSYFLIYKIIPNNRIHTDQHSVDR